MTALQKVYTERPANIAISTSTSAALNLASSGERVTIVGIETPAALTGTALTFTVSNDDSTYLPLYDAGGILVTIPVGTSRHIALDPADFMSVGWVKVVSNATESGARVIKLLVARYS